MRAALNEEKIDEKVEFLHRVDSINLLIFVALLIVTTITVWFFKHRRLRFVHETGLCIIYGMVIGLILGYAGMVERKRTTETVTLPKNSSFNSSDFPDLLLLKACVNESSGCDSSIVFRYTFDGEKEISKALQSQEIEKAVFNPELFFNILLPPIIFHAGYSMKRRHFFRNLGAVLTFAFAGTVISCFVVGGIVFAAVKLFNLTLFSFGDCLLFGALISATDPVTVLAIFGDIHADMDLYALVFGESVLNDAVAIVLANTVSAYSSSTGDTGEQLGMAVFNFIKVFGGSFLLGSAVGCLTALVTKFTRIHEHPVLETSLFFLMSYGSFLAAESAKLTGIVSVLFCGICQAHYTYNNLSDEAKRRSREFFELLNFLSENFVFLYIGISVFTFQHHEFHFGFVAFALLGVIVGRALNVYPLSFLLNLGRHNKIPFHFQHMMMFSGLRGAIAFALAIRDTLTEPRQVIFTTTLIIVVLTVILCGGTTVQMLSLLNIRVGVQDEKELDDLAAAAATSTRQYQSTATPQTSQQPNNNFGPPHSLPPANASSVVTQDTPSGHSRSEKAWLVLKWYRVDVMYVKPFLTHSRPTLLDTMPQNGCCQAIAKFLTTTRQLQTGDETGKSETYGSDVDLIIDDMQLSLESPAHSLRTNHTSGAGQSTSTKSAAGSLSNQRASQDEGISDEGWMCQVEVRNVKVVFDRIAVA